MVVKKQLIASVASDMLSALGPSLTERSRKELELLVEKPLEYSDSATATVSRPGKDSYWSGDGELNVRFGSSNLETDEETGDVYRSFKLNFTMNWSSHNEAVTSDTLAKLHMMTEVSTVGAALAQKYSETYKELVYTAAQVAERKVAAEKTALNQKVAVLAEHPVKGLRVGGNRREVSKTIFAGIPDGTYEVSYTNNYDTKKYTVDVTSWGVQVWRTA